MLTSLEGFIRKVGTGSRGRDERKEPLLPVGHGVPDEGHQVSPLVDTSLLSTTTNIIVPERPVFL